MSLDFVFNNPSACPVKQTSLRREIYKFMLSIESAFFTLSPFITSKVGTSEDRLCRKDLLDPGRDRLIPAAARIYPVASKGVAILAKLALVVRRRTSLAGPNHESITI